MCDRFRSIGYMVGGGGGASVGVAELRETP